MTGTARYKVIYETLKGEILGGKYSSAKSFPSSVALARRFRTTRATIRRTFDQLRAAGRICTRQGSGTVVTKRGRSRKIGLIVPGVTYSEIFPSIVGEVSRIAQDRGFMLFLGDVSAKRPEEQVRQVRSFVRKLLDEGVSGVIFQPIELIRDAESVNSEVLCELDGAGVPVVLLDCAATPGRTAHDVVGINNFEAGRNVALHLLDGGARNFVFVMNPYSDQSIQLRYLGAEGAVLAAGGQFKSMHLDPHDAKAVKRLLGLRPRPDAVICRNDTIAAHLIVALRRLGKSVPDDVKVSGFNDVSCATLVEPGVTTIRIPSRDIARKAFERLLDRIETPAQPPCDCYLPAPLVIRGSTRGNQPKVGGQASRARA